MTYSPQHTRSPRPRVNTPSWGRNPNATISQISRDRDQPSKFIERLSIPPPSLDVPIEGSKFSPDLSPIELPTAHHQRAQSTNSWRPTPNNGFYKAAPPPSTLRDTRMTGTTAAGPESPKATTRDRFTKLFFDLRTVGASREPEIMPIEPRPPWSPLHVDNKPSTSKKPPQYSFPPSSYDQSAHHLPLYRSPGKEEKKAPVWRAWALTTLAILLLYLFGSVIYLTASTATLRRRLDAMTIIKPPGTATGMPASVNVSDAASCIQQYTLNAPSASSQFPCSTCLPLLQQLSSSQEASGLSSSDAQAMSDGVSFCGLKSVFDSANSDGQAALSNGGWAKDIRFCAWTGVTCDGTGKVSSLKLITPAVPASLPLELGALASLQTLQIIGDGVLPAGSPSSSIFESLKSLTTLHLESTQLTQPSKSQLSTLTGVQPSLTTLTLVKNPNMGTSVLDAVMSIPLQNIIVTDQPLSSNVMSALATSVSLQGSLKTLDLSNTSLTGDVPTDFTVSLRTLNELKLGGNSGLTGTIPALP